MRILLIDRDKTQNQGIVFFLKSKGFAVDIAMSREEGME